MYLLAKILMTILSKILPRILCIKLCAGNPALIKIGRKKCVHVEMPKFISQRRLYLEKDGGRYQLLLVVVLKNEFHEISIF